ncbi:PmoA family protein [Planctomycetota bacterium]
MKLPLRLAIALVIAASAAAEARAVKLGTLTVEAGEHEREGTLVVFPCKLADLVGDRLTPEQLAKGSLRLTSDWMDSTFIPAQWDPLADHDPDPRTGALVLMLKGKAAPKTELPMTLTFDDRPGSTPLAVEDRDEKHLVFTCGGKGVLRYNYGVMKHAGGNTVYDRPCYIHPAWTPDGVVVTDDFPKDHYHQRGIFFAWVKTTCGDLHADYWNLGKKTGRTTFDKLTNVSAGPVVATMCSHNVLLAHEKPAIRERLIVRVWSLGGPWIFDVLVRHDAIDKPVTLDKNYYGGMAYRGAREWCDREKVAMLTSEGNDRKTGNLKHSRWVDTFGTIGGKPSGVVVFDHPSNPRHPQRNRLHPKVPYVGYILPQTAPYTIERGKPLTLQYRFLVYDGQPDQARNDRIARDLAEPPKVTWQRAK